MPKITKLTIPKGMRVLITSDIHGNLQRFKALLKRITFTPNDLLIINGDLTEKGEQSLETVRYIYELSQTHTIYLVQGNCETMHYLKDSQHFEKLRNYINSRQKSLIYEMLSTLDIEVSMEMDMEYARGKILEHYQPFYEYLSDLPNIIETDAFTVVHAGLEDKDLSAQDIATIQTMPLFGNNNQNFHKPVIVGHYPVCLYHEKIISHKPILDVMKNIYSIDGGNVIKQDGQLNVLIYKDGAFSVDYVDGLRYYDVLENQEGAPGVHISWMDREIEILDYKPEFIKVKQKNTGYSAWIHESFVDVLRLEVIDDVTDSILKLSVNDSFHPILETRNGYYGKHNGEVGWYYGQLGDYRETH